MADLKKAYLQGQQELEEARRRAAEEARLKREDEERTKEAQRKLHRENIEAATQLIKVFNQNAEIFSQHEIVYCLEEGQPGECPSVILFKRSSGPREMVLIRVDRYKTVGAYSFGSPVKSENWTETATTRTHHMSYQTVLYRDLPNDAAGAAAEIVRLLGKQEMTFGRLWEYDDSFKCVADYFYRRRVIQGTIMAAVAAAIIVFFIYGRG